MIKHLMFFLSLIFFYLLNGCTSSQTQNQNTGLNCTIVLGSGGGFTGSYDGIYIDSLGSVFRWTGRTFESAEKVLLKKLNEDEISSIINLIDTSGIQSADYTEHGNVSSFIILRKDKGEKRISWNGMEPDNKVPENIRSFYSAIKQITN